MHLAQLVPPLQQVWQQETVKPTFLCSALFLVGGYHFLQRHLPADHSARQRSWLLTLIASTVMTLGSLPNVYGLLTANLDLSQRPTEASALDPILCVFFITYLLMDLGIGMVSYPQHISLLTGWIHHGVYTTLVLHLLHLHFTSPFLMMTILELPTLVLSVGHIWPHLRHDWLFGLTFFSTRILFHALMIRQFYYTFPYAGWWIALVVALPLHLHWFYLWVTQQKRKYKDRMVALKQAAMERVGAVRVNGFGALLRRHKVADIAKAE